MTDTTTAQPSAMDRPAAIILCLIPILSVVFMAMHPTIEAKTTTAVFAEMAKEGSANRIVHGILISFAALQLLGFWGFALHQGPQRPLVIAGFFFYVLGVIGVCLGGTVNGFVVPFYEGLAASGPIEQQELARQVMRFGWSLNQGLIQVGVVAESVGILCWSVMLLRLSGAWRWVGGLGIVAGAAPGLGIISGALPMDFHGFGATVLIQSLWAINVGIQMARVAFRKT